MPCTPSGERCQPSSRKELSLKAAESLERRLVLLKTGGELQVKTNDFASAEDPKTVAKIFRLVLVLLKSKTAGTRMVVSLQL